MGMLVKRLIPGDDVKAQIEELVVETRLRAGVLISIVGSLKATKIRLADCGETLSIDRPVEIVSGTGTVSQSGMHIHIAVADGEGKTSGGHLLHGCIVHTTVELVIQDISGEWSFDREHCSLSGYKELVAEQN